MGVYNGVFHELRQVPGAGHAGGGGASANSRGGSPSSGGSRDPQQTPFRHY